MPLAFVVVIVGCLVVLYVETLVLVGTHTASFTDSYVATAHMFSLPRCDLSRWSDEKRCISTLTRWCVVRFRPIGQRERSRTRAAEAGRVVDTEVSLSRQECMDRGTSNAERCDRHAPDSDEREPPSTALRGGRPTNAPFTTWMTESTSRRR
jgi:hypothetical protein